MTLAQRIEEVHRTVARAARRAGREPNDVTIIGVCKTVDRDQVDAAYALGLRHFGENRVQDAARKFASPLAGDAELHMIGQLQTNKVRVAAPLFDVFQSVDRPSLIAALEREGERLARRLKVLVQVNVAGEAQKAGCGIDAVPALLARVLESPHLAISGLMTIAPLVTDPEQVRPVFHGLRKLRDELCRSHPDATLDVLSMGMSDDYAVAIEEGATHVRIGRAIFQD